jgi:hypothetical protein
VDDPGRASRGRPRVQVRAAAHGLEWRDPIPALENSERPRLGGTPEPRIYEAHEPAQTLAVSWEPWASLFRLTSVVGHRARRPGSAATRLRLSGGIGYQVVHFSAPEIGALFDAP